MISAEQNELMAPCGIDKPAGKLLHRSCEPLGFTDELEDKRPTKPREPAFMGCIITIVEETHASYHHPLLSWESLSGETERAGIRSKPT